MDADEIREMEREDLLATLKDMQQELMHERGVAAMGGAPPDPGRIRELRKTVARIKTIIHEQDTLDQAERGTA